MRHSIQFVRDYLGKDLVCAEMGVQRGINAKDILLLDVKRLYLVDPYPKGLHPDVEKWYEEVLGYTRPHFRKVVFLIMTSMQASKILNETFDFIYLDAKHDYDNVKLDISVWYPKIRRGGVLCGHDYHLHSDGRAGVVKAVNEFAQREKLKLNYIYRKDVGFETDWWVIKP